MKKPAKRIIFDNYHNGDFEEQRKCIFENFMEGSSWESADDVTDDEVFRFQQEEDELAWEAGQEEMEAFFGKGKYLLMGTIGRWNGPAEGGFIFSSLDELRKAWKDCDYISIYDENGHFHIKCSHHDGTNRYEVRELTPAGAAYAERNEWDLNPRDLHTKLWNRSGYSRLPHFAHRVYGCTRTAYEEDQKSA